MKKIVSVVLNNFVNDARVYKESVTLISDGNDVTVVCLYDPGLPVKEQKEGIKIHRIRLITRYLPGNVFFSGIKYLEFLCKVVSSHRKADVFHCHDLNTLAVGALVKIFRRKKVNLIYDAHEFETEQLANPGKWQHTFSVWLEGLLLKYTDAVITVSASIADEYAIRYRIPVPELVLNCPPFQPFTKGRKFHETLSLAPEIKVLLYQGGLSSERGLEILLQAFTLLKDPGIVLVIMGYGPLEPLVREYTERNANIFLIPAVSQQQLPYYTSSADVGILFYENTCLNNYYCMPNKLFEYLMSGVPVLVSPLFELKRIVETHQLGIVAEGINVPCLLDAILSFGDFDHLQFSQRVKEFNALYNWENQALKLRKIYKDLCVE